MHQSHTSQHPRKGISRITVYLALLFSTSFAMFSMFFGSGNLVFPLMIGKVVGDQYASAILGLMLTGVVIPFLGLFALLLFSGSYKRFFGRFDKYTSFIVPLFILTLIGPLAGIPRCITVAYGSFSLLVDNLSLPVFSVCMCGVIFLLTLDHNKIIPLLGSILTPFLLVSLALIIYYGVVQSPPLEVGPSVEKAFTVGMIEGYQTMDLLAAFFFGATVVHYMKRKLYHRVHSGVAKRRMILASLIMGATLLGIIYAFLVYLGGGYAPILNMEQAERSLALIAYETLGPLAGPIVSTAVVLACLTTAIVLTSVSTEFYYEKILRKKVNLHVVTVATLLGAFSISILQFKGIALFLKPILDATYPSIIVFTFVSIAYKLWKFRPLKAPVFITFFITLMVMLTTRVLF